MEYQTQNLTKEVLVRLAKLQSDMEYIKEHMVDVDTILTDDERRLLDEIFITIEPLIFGRGKDMFVGGNKTTELCLLSVKQLNIRGTLLLHYQVNHPKL